MLTMSVGVGKTFKAFCLSVCLFVCLFFCPQHISKTNDPKVVRVGIGNDFGIS